MEPMIGDTVKWDTSRKPLGKVVHKFCHKLILYAVVESEKGLSVVRVYDRLLIVSRKANTGD